MILPTYQKMKVQLQLVHLWYSLSKGVVVLVEEQKSNSCNYEPSSSVPTDDILLSSSSGTLTDETYPSTSTAETNIFDEKATLQDCQLSRIIRRRCRFLLPSSISHKLLRIVLKQPTTLKHLSAILMFQTFC